MGKDVKCRTVYRFICEHLDAESNSPRFRAVRAHLAKCSMCQRFLGSLKKTVDLYCAEPEVKVPRTTHDRLMKALREERNPR